ncbi:MAG: hypothetical protein R6X02_11465, partial [Enhygromyxa sp.]
MVEIDPQQLFCLTPQQRIVEMVARLNQLGIGLQVERVFAIANCRSPGRPHVGRALVECGFCGSVDEAFERYLKQNRPAWVPKNAEELELLGLYEVAQRVRSNAQSLRHADTLD